MKKIGTPIKIKNLIIKNRFVMPALGSFLTEERGYVGQMLINYYRRRAQGGVGLLIVEASAVSADGFVSSRQLCNYDDSYLPGLTDLASAIKAEGVRVALQIHHAGRQTASKITGQKPVAPSPLPCPSIGEIPHELTIPEIAEIIIKFGNAAERGKKAGFEAIEIHGAHGYLINQFLSPFSNLRTDRYGGSLNNRLRIAIEIIREVRQRVGEDMPVIFRLTAEEFVDGGLSLKDSVEIARILESEGIDALHVSAGNDATPEWISQPMLIPPGCLTHLAAGIKKEISIPVIAVGRINNPDLAEAVIEEGKADLVSIGRGLVVDPDFPKKYFEGRKQEIRRCMGCNTCIQSIFRKARMECQINPFLGREPEANFEKTLNPQRVLVIGGGPAGLEAAWIAKSRGHEVILLEKDIRLGGHVNVASVPPAKEELTTIIAHQKVMLDKYGVEYHLNQEVTPEVIENINPEVVILASGSTPILPDIPGIDSKTVSTAYDLLAGQTEVGERVAIIGGGSVGCETAEYLARKGKKVSIFEMQAKVAADLEAMTRKLRLKRLKDLEVKIYTNSKVLRIDPGLLMYSNGKDTQYYSGVDNVILAIGLKPRNGLVKTLETGKYKYFVIGDCDGPEMLKKAIHGGTLVGLQI